MKHEMLSPIKLSVMVNIDYHLGRTRTHLGDKHQALL